MNAQSVNLNQSMASTLYNQKQQFLRGYSSLKERYEVKGFLDSSKEAQ